MKTKHKKLILYSGIITGSLFFTLSSCKKDVPLKQDVPPKVRTMAGEIVIDQRWINIRNKARREYDYYFASYYHTRDILKEVDWDHAIVNYDDDGNKVMVFQMAKREDIPTDARLMVIQKPGGETAYRIRMKSGDSDYASIYSAEDKMLYVGKMEGDVFKPEGQMALKGTTVLGKSMCDGCHSGDGYPYPGGGGGGTPYPGSGNSGNIWDNNLLGEVNIYDSYPDPKFPDRPNIWDGTVVVIPAGVDDNNIDNNPCAKFKALMANQAFRQKLQELLSNTTLNRETAFTMNGTNISAWIYGAIGGGSVDAGFDVNRTTFAHSHSTGMSPNFTPADLQQLYISFNNLNFFMDYVAVVVTPYGTYMIKVINQNAFNDFGAQWLSNQAQLNALAAKYHLYGMYDGTFTGDLLRDLLADLNSGLSIFKIPDLNNSNPPCN